LYELFKMFYKNILLIIWFNLVSMKNKEYIRWFKKIIDYFYFNTIMEQPKTEQILRMLVMLSGGICYTIKDLAQRFNKSERSIYRDLNTIENAGFVLDRDHGNYSLHLYKDQTKMMNTLFHFSEEEGYVLYRALDQLKVGTQVSNQLVRKLNVLYDFKALSNLSRKTEVEIINTLSNALTQKKQVKLCSYRSSHSETISDRVVEPFTFLSEYSGIWCYDTHDTICKQFKISRIEKVEILNSVWQNEILHKVPFVDAFRMSARIAIDTIEAELTLKASNLLSEEFPLAEPCLKLIGQNPIRYSLSIQVADYHGIGRFVIGLPGEVKVNGSDKFKLFLEKIRNKRITDGICQ